MYSIVSTAIIMGIQSIPVQVEADVSNGMPLFEMVGFLASEVKEARERVRTALKNSGYLLPAKRITVNLSPANIKKTGSGFDLPVAIAILAALGIIPEERLQGILVVGEIGLNGNIQPTEGVLPMVAEAKKQGFTRCLLPYGNYREASVIHNVELIALRHLTEAIRYLNGDGAPAPESGTEAAGADIMGEGQRDGEETQPDFAQINGQRLLRRAGEVAAAGMHNFLMTGAPGAGKTMLAQRIPSILPPMEEAERLELAKIYSVSGMLLKEAHILEKRPFRSPHHTITPQGLVGGGTIPKPGEISLAHKGVLFLDELAEFSKPTLELLRQPMEAKEIQIARLHGTISYPADFMLVAAMNPCPCGAYPDMNRCHCTQSAINRYLGKISRPLLDRIDICVETAPLTYEEVAAQGKNEPSAVIRQRVCEAWERQKARFAGTGIYFNSRIPAQRLKEYCGMGTAEEAFMQDVYRQNGLTARSYHKILRVARTIADLSGSADVRVEHLSEAACYRSLDRNYWERG